jgi:hypothetical protein
MEPDNLPKHEAAFFLMRQATLPARMIGNQPHAQTIQINANIFTDDTPEQAIGRIKTMESYVEKLQCFHEARFIEQMMEQVRERMKSELDVLETLQGEAKSPQGRAMPTNRKDMLKNLPGQVEKTKKALEILQAQLEEKQAIAKDLL